MLLISQSLNLLCFGAMTSECVPAPAALAMNLGTSTWLPAIFYTPSASPHPGRFSGITVDKRIANQNSVCKMRVEIRMWGTSLSDLFPPNHWVLLQNR